MTIVWQGLLNMDMCFASVMSFGLSSLTFFSLKGDGRMVENSEGATYTFGFGSGMLGADDLSGASQHTSQKSTKWDFGFDFTPALAQDTTMSHPSSENEQNNTKKGLHSSPDDGVDADEESWEFKDAFSETGSKNKVMSLFIYLFLRFNSV